MSRTYRKSRDTDKISKSNYVKKCVDKLVNETTYFWETTQKDKKRYEDDMKKYQFLYNAWKHTRHNSYNTKPKMPLEYTYRSYRIDYVTYDLEKEIIKYERQYERAKRDKDYRLNYDYVVVHKKHSAKDVRHINKEFCTKILKQCETCELNPYPYTYAKRKHVTDYW